MKYLSAVFSALVVVGFAGAASAAGGCSGAAKADQTAETPIIVQSDTVGS